MNSSSFTVARFRSLSTRESGAEAREMVMGAIRAGEAVVLDFQDAHPTPSFADELVGRLAEELGEDEFRERVRIIHVGESERPLLQQVITRRLNRGAHA